MDFFEAVISKDGKKLFFRMSLFIRGSVFAALFLMAAVIAFTVTPQAFAEYPLAGQINIIVLPILLLLASCWRYTLEFDKDTRKVRLIKGFFFLSRIRSWDFGQLTGVIYREYKTHLVEALSHPRCEFGFTFEGERLLLDRDIPASKSRSFLLTFRTFFPGAETLLANSGILT